jgi:hypothetical protein
VTGTERRARSIARGRSDVTPRKLAKLAGIHIDVARRLIGEEAKRREKARA